MELWWYCRTSVAAPCPPPGSEDTRESKIRVSFTLLTWTVRRTREEERQSRIWKALGCCPTAI
eukprot:1158314-Pelagomonas_calceolata.AAC.3